VFFRDSGSPPSRPSPPTQQVRPSLGTSQYRPRLEKPDLDPFTWFEPKRFAIGLEVPFDERKPLRGPLKQPVLCGCRELDYREGAAVIGRQFKVPLIS
jgi:hypothetical protein